MERFVFVLFIILIGCKNQENSTLEKIWREKSNEMEEEGIAHQHLEDIYTDFKDNLENELRGTELELLRVNKLNDSLLNELYKCQNQ